MAKTNRATNDADPPAAAADATTPAPDAAGGPAGPSGVAELAARSADEVATLERELAEIEMLIAQARNEAARHEARRAALAEKLAGLAPDSDPAERADLNAQLVTLTRRASVMEAQVDVLDGKQRTIARFRDSLAAYAAGLAAAVGAGAGAGPGPGADGDAGGAADEGEAPGGSVSRLLLGAQEDLRREIARAMHDGPAQSLTNIVLQAEIVEHTLDRDPGAARTELQLLVSMVQQTLEATKSFIFDVRPMVLDDLGLVPTLRRATRERGRRAQVPVEFESLGADRRLPMDVESGLFRMIDEALAAYLDGRPDRVVVRLDWTESQLDASVRAIREGLDEEEAAPAPPARGSGGEKAKAHDLPPALAAMIEDSQARAAAAAEAARAARRVVLPPTTWREIGTRAGTLGIRADLLDHGMTLDLVVELAGEPGR